MTLMVLTASMACTAALAEIDDVGIRRIDGERHVIPGR